MRTDWPDKGMDGENGHEDGRSPNVLYPFVAAAVISVMLMIIFMIQ
jgi:hypothetical protein